VSAVQKLTDYQLAELRSERDALCRQLLANPKDPERRAVRQRLRVLAFLMKRYDEAGQSHQDADVGHMASDHEFDDADLQPVNVAHPPLQVEPLPIPLAYLAPTYPPLNSNRGFEVIPIASYGLRPLPDGPPVDPSVLAGAMRELEQSGDRPPPLTEEQILAILAEDDAAGRR
jgi:hypothetical protein